MKKTFLIWIALIFLTISAVGDSDVPPLKMLTTDGELYLNGIGYKKIFFIKIYQGALYLKRNYENIRDLIEADEAMAIRLEFLYPKVTRDEIINGWEESFRAINPGYWTLFPRELSLFYSFFYADAQSSDTCELVYLPQKGLSVYIRGQFMGIVEGLEFKKLVFSVWLGEIPTDEKLKRELLGTES